MKKRNPSKAQLRRDNARLQRAAQDSRQTADSLWRSQAAAENQRDMALEIVRDLAPDVWRLLTQPDRLPSDPGVPMVRELPRVTVPRALHNAYSSSFSEKPIEHWLTRMWVDVLRNCREPRQRLLVFRMQRPVNQPSNVWNQAFDDRMLTDCPSAACVIVEQLAAAVCRDLQAKIGGRRG